jgi:hypothetical protein
MRASEQFEAMVKKDIPLKDGMKIDKGTKITLHDVDGHTYLSHLGSIHYIKKEYLEDEGSIN